jgi:hypothetical protein
MSYTNEIFNQYGKPAPVPENILEKIKKIDKIYSFSWAI